jgi:hypothetical protein
LLNLGVKFAIKKLVDFCAVNAEHTCQFDALHWATLERLQDLLWKGDLSGVILFGLRHLVLQRAWVYCNIGPQA